MRFFGLFEGIGGFRLTAESMGWESVGYCEKDRFALQTYRANFETEGEWFAEDATKADFSTVADFDILFAGFPCQPFSVAGKRKGEADPRGTLFYEIIRMLKAKKPSMFLLENVKGLTNKTFARTMTTIVRLLQERGYRVSTSVLNTADYGIPQHRERIFFFGQLHSSSDGFSSEFMWPKPIPLRLKLKDVLETDVPEKYYLSEPSQRFMARNGNFLRQEVATTLAANEYKKGMRINIVSSGLIHSRGMEFKNDGTVHALKGAEGGSSKNVIYIHPHGNNGGGFMESDISGSVRGAWRAAGNQGIVQPTPLKFIERNQKNVNPDYSFTVDSANTGGIMEIANSVTDSHLMKRIRRLTPRECARLQGFPESFKIPVSDTQAYKQFGNAVSINVVKAILQAIQEDSQ